MSKFTLEIEPSEVLHTKFGTAKDESCNQGFLWAYQYYEDGKRKIISRVNLEDLEKEVVKRKLEWYKFEKEMV